MSRGVPLAGVEKDDLHLPVAISHVFTTPDKSLVTATPSSVKRLTDSIAAKASGVGSSSVVIESANVWEGLIFQNFTDQSLDPEMREEEKTMEMMSSVCPTRSPMRQGCELVISQTWIISPAVTGGKGWCTELVHHKYIARKWTMYPAFTHSVHLKYILSRFHPFYR